MKKYLFVILFALLLLITPTFASENTQIPILMYHHIDNKYQNNNLIVTPKRFEEDMRFLESNGYTALLSKDLIAICNGTVEMPQKPIMITFDDGYESNYKYAYPVLKKYGMKATIAVISSVMRGENYGPENFLKWSECKEMYESGCVDIGTHSNNLHNPETRGCFKKGGPNGVERLENEIKEDYWERVKTDLEFSKNIIQQYVGNDVIYLAYPFGAADQWCEEIADEIDIKVTTTTCTDIADVSNVLRKLPRIRVSMGRSVREILNQRSVKTNKVTVKINDGSYQLCVYNILDNNYLKLRDVAMILSGTECEHNIIWNNKRKMIELQSGKVYKKVGGELSLLNNNEVKANEKTACILFNEEQINLESYLIDGYYYFKLGDLSKLLSFEYDWDSTNNSLYIKTH